MTPKMRKMKRPATAVCLSIGALTVAACSTVGPSAPARAPLAASSAPKPVTSYDWFYHEDAGQAQLVFGMEASDDIQMGLSCAARSGKLEIFAIAEAPRDIHLESGGDTERFKAGAEPSELHDGSILTAEGPANLPVFARFRRLGWMASLHDGRRDMFVAHPGTLANVERFFDFCG
ncbi:hypothetical protein KOAAANKH_02972 [Brevundimonas sp. NIBR10]|nr:hypothetical protein KOAAANKH_02972 [Brevundimonas sp. NIBR10]